MKKVKIMILFIVLGMLLIIPNSAHAGYQSKPGEALTGKYADVHFVGCRKMETSGGVLGLEEGLNDDYTGTTVGGNGIDAHMALNTEWGTIALFTNSQYGVKTGISGQKNDSTSTGNATGIYGLANSTAETVASSYDGQTAVYGATIRSANERYFNNYASQTTKAGDALECQKWLGADVNGWITAGRPVFLRNFSYTLFGFSYSGGGSNLGMGSTRAVVVCGAGL